MADSESGAGKVTSLKHLVKNKKHLVKARKPSKVMSKVMSKEFRSE